MEKNLGILLNATGRRSNGVLRILENITKSRTGKLVVIEGVMDGKNLPKHFRYDNQAFKQLEAFGSFYEKIVATTDSKKYETVKLVSFMDCLHFLESNSALEGRCLR